MQTEVTVLADSVSPDGVRLTTLLCIYPRFIHSEMLRHRMFSHSVASSRAIPTEKNIEQVMSDPFIPTTFNKRVKGMGVGEAFSGWRGWSARFAWRRAAQFAAFIAWIMVKLDVDKSRANRLLEPFLYVADIITATEWDNFFALRDHSAAQPEFQELARKMREAMDVSEALYLNYGEWHLPLVSVDEVQGDGINPMEIDWPRWKEVSASRCAAISYSKHAEGEGVETSLGRFNRLASASPPHLSPLEHAATPFKVGQWHRVRRLQEAERNRLDAEGILPGNHFEQMLDQMEFVGNLRGWVQFRKEYENEGRADLLMEGVTA